MRSEQLVLSTPVEVVCSEANIRDIDPLLYTVPNKRENEGGERGGEGVREGVIEHHNHHHPFA